MLKGCVLGFVCFLMFLFLHAVIFHNRRIKYRFSTLLRIFFSLLPVYILLYIFIPTEAMIVMPADPGITPGVVLGISKTFNFLLGIAVYILLFFGYCQFYFIIDRSVSVRIMIEIEKAKDKQLTLEAIKRIYSPDYIFLRRLQQMVDSRYLVKDSEGYKNSRKGIMTAKLFEFLKKYLQIGEGG